MRCAVLLIIFTTALQSAEMIFNKPYSEIFPKSGNGLMELRILFIDAVKSSAGLIEPEMYNAYIIGDVDMLYNEKSYIKFIVSKWKSPAQFTQSIMVVKGKQLDKEGKLFELLYYDREKK